MDPKQLDALYAQLDYAHKGGPRNQDPSLPPSAYVIPNGLPDNMNGAQLSEALHALHEKFLAEQLDQKPQPLQPDVQPSPPPQAPPPAPARRGTAKRHPPLIGRY